jgi:deoxycytidine triphosphate deaminase
LDIICVRPVRSAFKDELTIVFDDHGKAVTIEAIVLEANEAVVLEANETVVLEANETVVFEANEAVVFDV